MATGYTPVDIRYRPASVWFYPTITVFARSASVADSRAGEQDGVTFFYVAMDSIAAQLRLGLFGCSKAANLRMLRGD